ncbi:PREDICTED: calmodulin-like protein 3 isoform X2 [Populus euphratica]|uniref:Calmodulin-like protein 3 isoform X2 n=1 Tax=Populus euphratica TaxID=75702 RepID=A0AAJ6XIF9_POPEU|nr:PREDICTED: calmodulin-like protein 3 isoform X2 [Populus euphratica]
MMMIITIFLLLVLFLAGLINVYFYLPSKKLYAWLQSFASKNPATTITPQVSHKERSITTSSLSISISSSSSPAYDKAELKSVFATFDKNGDGFITKQELRESFKNIRIFMTEKEVEEMVVKVDTNGDGLIDFEEFCILCKAIGFRDQGGDDEKEGRQDGGEEDLKEAFDVFDKDKDGLISVEELGLMLCSLGLKEGGRVEDCKEMIRKVDMDGDGMVNFDEFKRMMTRGGSKLVSVF